MGIRNHSIYQFFWHLTIKAQRMQCDYTVGFWTPVRSPITFCLSGDGEDAKDKCSAWAKANSCNHPGQLDLKWNVWESTLGKFIQDENSPPNFPRILPPNDLSSFLVSIFLKQKSFSFHLFKEIGQLEVYFLQLEVIWSWYVQSDVSWSIFINFLQPWDFYVIIFQA